MKQFKFNLLFWGVVAFYAVASCSKPDVVEQEDGKDTDVETPDTTEKVDTITPADSVKPDGTFMIQTVFSGGNSSEVEWKTSWLPEDAVNVFTIQGTEPNDDERKWTNHGKFVFDSASDGLWGNRATRLFSNETYLWYAVYPYSESFTDPAGLDKPYDGQILTIGHKPGEYAVQNGYNNTEHLSGPYMPLYGAATAKGNVTPEFRMHQMAAVIRVKAINATSAPLKITDAKIVASGNCYLAGDFAVDFSKTTTLGHPNTNMMRVPIVAGDGASVLKVEGAEELPVGETAEFYLPIMPNKFWTGSSFTVTVNDYVETIVMKSDQTISGGRMYTLTVTVIDPVPVELIAPADDSEIDLSSVEKVDFSWKPVENHDSYVVLFSASEDMSSPIRVEVEGSTLSLDAYTFDYYAFQLGVDAGQSASLFWSAVAASDERATMVNRLSVKRAPMEAYEDRIADPLTVKVAILYEDFEVPGTGGKRMHEVCALYAKGGYNINGGGWYDPTKLVKEYEEGLEKSSHGVVNYEVVKTIYADRFFTYFNDQIGWDGNIRSYITLDTLLYLFETRQVDNNTTYDYVGMMKYYGFDEMVDAGELDEVWVYSFPAGGMNESRMIGNGAFWCNSTGIGTGQGAPCEELCIVMGLNYERTADLALHSCCHRVESIMAQVYENKGGLYGWNFDKKGSIDQLTNWEKFSAHNLKYDKFEANHAHIGKCHFPPNSQQDYDYDNARYVYSYADTWYDYPYIREENARRINNTEWKHSGGGQYGYMLWYYDHLPHFKGICPRDGHLNNWWHYIVDYNGAMRYEKQLRDEMSAQ